jgi:hypothetical protein
VKRNTPLRPVPYGSQGKAIFRVPVVVETAEACDNIYEPAPERMQPDLQRVEFALGVAEYERHVGVSVG